MAFWYDATVTQGSVVGRYQRIMIMVASLQAAIESRIAEKYAPGGFLFETARSFVDPTVTDWEAHTTLILRMKFWTKYRLLLISQKLSTLDNYRHLNTKVQKWGKPEVVKAVCGDPPPDGSYLWGAISKREIAIEEDTGVSDSDDRDLLLTVMCYTEPEYTKEDRAFVNAWDTWRNAFLAKFNEYVGEHNEITRFFFTSSMAQADQALAYWNEIHKWVEKAQTEFGAKYRQVQLASIAEVEAMKPTSGIPWVSLAVLAVAGVGIYALTKVPSLGGGGGAKEPPKPEDAKRPEDDDEKKAVERERRRMAEWPESKALERAKLARQR